MFAVATRRGVLGERPTRTTSAAAPQLGVEAFQRPSVDLGQRGLAQRRLDGALDVSR